MLIRVTDAADARLDRFRWRDRQLASRRDRAETVGAGLFVAEGDLVVGRAIEAGCTPVAYLCDEAWAEDNAARLVDADVFVGDEPLRREVTGLGVPLRATGLFVRPAPRDPAVLAASSRRLIIVESVDNPTNLGAIVRSASALGWDALILDSVSTDPLARRALRVSMGTALTLPFARLAPDQTLSAFLNAHEIAAIALTPDANAEDIANVSIGGDRVALVFGSERDGVSAETLRASRYSARIPMHGGVDSLNVGAAAAVAMYVLGPDSRR